VFDRVLIPVLMVLIPVLMVLMPVLILVFIPVFIPVLTFVLTFVTTGTLLFGAHACAKARVLHCLPSQQHMLSVYWLLVFFL
jgi:hypothetical protein